MSLSLRRARITAAVEDMSTHRSVLRRCVSEMCKNTGVSKVFVNGRLKSNALTLTSRTQKPKPPTPQRCVFPRPKSHFWCETGRCHQSWWSKDDEKHQYYQGFSVCVEYSLTLKKPHLTKFIGFYRKTCMARRPPHEGRTAPQGTLQEHTIHYKTNGCSIILVIVTKDLADRILEATFFTEAKKKKDVTKH